MKARVFSLYIVVIILFFNTSPVIAETITCSANTTDQCTKIDRKCSVADDCVNNIGKSLCSNGYCYLDEAAKLEYERNRTSFVWGLVTFQNDLDVKLKPPVLQIKFPGLEFSDTKQSLDADGYINIPYIGEFITALYKYGIALASIIAVVLIIKNGVKIILSAGGDEKLESYHQIGQIMIGLIILWGSYAFLYTISPNLVQFKPLRIQYIEPPTIEYEPDSVEGGTVAKTVSVAGTNLRSGARVTVAEEFVLPLQLAAIELTKQSVLLYITSGFRSIQSQIEQIKDNCLNPPGSKTCNHKPGKPNTCILQNKDPTKCPHTTGRAIDAWGFRNGEQCISRAECIKNMVKCRENECQAAVIAEMRRQGFCNIPSEAWHFEKPAMSANCT
ncbi:MAG: hypothetical protein A3I29_03370 [Candidatus Magasanikbacteria bacterium RIFCSPLOWO2_02_FULL_44_11]|uniref:Peptidase M15B domain-containing protein n=1 Tax=Candidatus Magasanikbacteria bacterium RIFCSPLOWO2_02_FULL_44_11 TaxID=1798689 RepID=A0A1F6NAT9_9BACT|nr:MAG: hypothetical protein A3I29_03370 [Candidatus Magasanikbacteria bacterium RIFCSPLOWO2_02_FULL_44_11]